MKKLKNLFAVAVILFTYNSIFAQAGIKTDIPVDPSVRIGVLENGLTYYIKQNKIPENRGEFYLVVNAGAIQETPGQNGLAHFTEHMCFNGTKNFEKHDIIHYLQSIGMKFGPEINAYTVTDRTVYTLNKVPLENKANMDTALMILYDWGCNVSEESAEIDAERGVIREEFRTRMSGMARTQMEVQSVMYKGSKYELHNVIGDTNVINYAPYDTLRDFYKQWYRPDLEAIVVVGDFDVDEMEGKVKSMFAKMPAHKDAKKREYYQVPGHKEARVVISKDKEAPYNVIEIAYKRPSNLDRSKKYYRSQYADQLYSSMLNARLNEIIQSANPPFSYAFSGNSGMLPTVDAYISFAVAPNDKISEAINVLLTENERVKRYGFSASEIERAKKEMMTSVEKSYKERNKQKSDKYAVALLENYLTSQPIPSDDWDYTFAKEALADISLEEINSLAKNWITDDNIVVGIMGLDAENVIYPSKDEILKMLDAAKTANIEAYVDKFANRPLVAEEPVAGTIVKETTDAKKGVIRWELSNGVKVVIKTTDFKDDEILMSASSLGGWSVYQKKDDVSAKTAADVVSSSGLGDFDNIELQKQLAGKSANVNPYISELTEGFSGRSNINDFETMLQMTYLYFTKPRADKDAFESYIQSEKSSLENKIANPESAFSDTITNTLAQHNNRFEPMSVAKLAEANLSRIKYIFKDRFGDPSGFTFYFVGNIDPNKDKENILKYLGGLPTVNRQETWVNLGKELPKKVVHNAYTRELKTPKSTVFIAFTGDFKYDIKDRLLLDAVKEYLDIRMLETLREDQGGTYGASVFSQSKHYPKSEYFVGVYFDCNPAKLDTMIKIVYDELSKMQNNALDDKSIHNIAENKLKDFQESKKENRYWLTKIVSDDYDQENYLGFDYEKFWSTIKAADVQKAAKKFLSKDRVVQIVTSNTDVNGLK